MVSGLKNTLPVKNGIKQPTPTSTCGKIWEVLDRLKKEHKKTLTIKEVLIKCKAFRWNENNLRAEYNRWKKFNSLK